LLHSKDNILQNALTRWSTLKKILKAQSALGEKAVIASSPSGALRNKSAHFFSQFFLLIFNLTKLH
jgi:hypothetical protein